MFRFDKSKMPTSHSPQYRILRYESLESRRLLAVLTVTNSNDDGEGSLRAAVRQANERQSHDTIVFDEVLTGETITLTTGAVAVSFDLTIDGSSADNLTISAGDNSEVFIFTTNTYVLRRLDISNGYTPGSGGAIFAFPGHDLTIEDSVIRDSYAGTAGGGISSARGTLRMVRSTVLNNTAGNQAGGINFEGTNATITNSTFSGNTVEESGSTAGGGGFGNFAFNGQTASVSLRNVTMANNSARFGEAFTTLLGTGGVSAETSYQNSVFFSEGPETNLFAYSGGINSSFGYNISNDDTGNLSSPGDMPNTDAQLGPLEMSGGTLVHALMPGSPALDAGDPAAMAGVGTTLLHDQRGERYDRVVGGRLDIGAYEVQVPPTGDFNQDGHVNGLDFLIWQRGFSLSTAAILAIGDSDADEDVDAKDLAIWSAFYALSANPGGVQSRNPIADNAWALFTVPLIDITDARFAAEFLQEVEPSGTLTSVIDGAFSDLSLNYPQAVSSILSESLLALHNDIIDLEVTFDRALIAS